MLTVPFRLQQAICSHEMLLLYPTFFLTPELLVIWSQAGVPPGEELTGGSIGGARKTVSPSPSFLDWISSRPALRGPNYQTV